MSDKTYENLKLRARGEVNAYAQGKRLEYKVQNELRELGFVTMRAAGSKGAVDIMAVRPGELLFVQVKRTTPPGPAPWNLLYDMADWCGGIPVLATCLPYKPITYERIVFRKPLPKARDHRVDPSGRVPYVLKATVELQEAELEEEGPDDGWA
jgi:hypothetical protein